MKSKILWEAKQSQKNKSNLFRYENFLSSKYKFIPTQNYNKLHKYSSQSRNIIRLSQYLFIIYFNQEAK